MSDEEGITRRQALGAGLAGAASLAVMTGASGEAEAASPEGRRKASSRERMPVAFMLPLMVVAGAAGAERGKTAYNGSFMGLRLSAYHFGA